LRPPAGVAGPDGGRRLEPETPERERSGTQAERRETDAPERKPAEDPEKELRRVRTRALVRHACAVDAIFEAQERAMEPSVSDRRCQRQAPPLSSDCLEITPREKCERSMFS
jgi:hypothetical protein